MQTSRRWSFDLASIFLTIIATILILDSFIRDSWLFLLIGIIGLIAAMGFLVLPEMIKRKEPDAEITNEDTDKLKATLAELETTLMELHRDQEGVKRAGHVMESGVQEISDGVALAIEKIRGMSDTQEQLIALRQESGEAKRHIDEWLEASMEYMDFLDRTLRLEGIDENYVKAIEKARSQFVSRLVGLGVSEISPEVGDEVDERLHRAEGFEDAEGLPSGVIAVVICTGFATGRKVLRPAIVRVTQ